MGFLSKIFKPVSKVLDKIVPNEVKPFLPYAAAFAPMLAPGIMGSSMLSRGLMSGGLNIGAQLAQEGNEGDINELSALLAGGIGALSTPGSTGGRTLPDGSGGSYSQVMTGGDQLASAGNQSAGEYLRGLSSSGGIGDKALNFLGTGADKLSAINAAGAADPFSKAGLKAAAIPLSQATGDLAYADAQRALRDYENSQGGGSGYTEGDDTNRGLAVRRAMERGGHEEQTIQDMLESLQYPDPDPQPLAYGGRVGYSLGNLVRGSGIAQPVSASMTAGEAPSMPSSGMGGMISKLINSNPQIFSNLNKGGNENGIGKMVSNMVNNNPQLFSKNNDIDFIDENRNGIDDRQEKAYGGRVNAMGGGIMSNQRGLVNLSGGYAGKLTREDVSKAYKDSREAESLLSEMIKNGKIDTEDYKIVKKNILSIENISNKNFDDYENKEELKQAQEDLSRWTKRINQLDERFKKDFNMRANGGRINFRGGGMDASSPDFGGIKEAIKNVDMKEKEDIMQDKSTEDMIMIMTDDGPKMIKRSHYEAMPGMFRDTTTSLYGDAARGRPVPKFAGGGVASVLPQGMEMDYRGGGFIPMGSKERADDVPARVSKNEFVMTADAVKAAGGGSVNQGAKRMYNLMNNLEARV